MKGQVLIFIRSIIQTIVNVVDVQRNLPSFELDQQTISL
jgi:hypothetical protein